MSVCLAVTCHMSNDYGTRFPPAYRNGIGAIPRDKVRLGHGHGVSPGVEPLSPSKQDN